MQQDRLRNPKNSVQGQDEGNSLVTGGDIANPPFLVVSIRSLFDQIVHTGDHLQIRNIGTLPDDVFPKLRNTKALPENLLDLFLDCKDDPQLILTLHR